MGSWPNTSPYTNTSSERAINNDNTTCYIASKNKPYLIVRFKQKLPITGVELITSMENSQPNYEIYSKSGRCPTVDYSIPNDGIFRHRCNSSFKTDSLRVISDDVLKICEIKFFSSIGKLF